MAAAQPSTGIPPSLITPDRVETHLGTLEFKDGAPSSDTVQKIYDNLDYIRGVDAFMNSFGGASAYAIRQGFHDIGAEDNAVVIFSELMDSNSLFLTANADTIYSVAILDLTKGPLVVEVPPKALGTINDMWFGWIIDVGGPGPDRGEGGRYLIVPPVYDGPLPDSGFHLGRSRTLHVLYAVRAYLVDDDPKPAVALIKKALKIYQYTPGGFGTSIATALEDRVRLEGNPPVPPTTFIEASGKSFNTIPPNDFSYFEMINELVQMEPATSFDPELLGQLAAIGIVKGKPFNPDARMRKILTDAAAVGNAAGRALNWRADEYPGWAIYPGSMWTNALWQGGYNFETPPPMINREGFKPFPPTGTRTLDSRTAFYYGYTMDSPGMIMRLPNAGSQYLIGFVDADKNYLDGGKTYKVTLPPNIPAAEFWSFTVYDNQLVRCSRHRSAIRVQEARRTRHRPQLQIQMAPRQSISAHPSQPAQRTATGFRLRQAKAGLRFCASTARSSRSLPKRGGQARSNWSGEAKIRHRNSGNRLRSARRAMPGPRGRQR